MLYDRIKALYEHSRLEHYRKLFGRIREKDGSLSATEAYSADVIYLLGNPTVSSFADLLGISQSYISRLEKRIILRLRRELIRQF